MTLNLIVLILLVLAALWSVMAGTLLRAAIGLALTSIVLTVLMFNLASPLAAVFELSVCAGLITVIFMSTISLAKPLNLEETARQARRHVKKYWYLPMLVLIAGAALAVVTIPLDFALPPQAAGADVRTVLWTDRQLDILGQILILLTGVFGIVVLFKERHDH